MSHEMLVICIAEEKRLCGTKMYMKPSKDTIHTTYQINKDIQSAQLEHL